MNRTVCIIPYESFETYAIEQWLDAQALKGLLLERIWGGFAIFRRTEPSQTRYRLDILTSEKYDMEQEIREEANKYGWSYVCDFAWHDYSVFCTNDPDSTELHTDPAVLCSAMKGRMIFNYSALAILLVYLLFRCFQPDGLFAVMRNKSSLLYTSQLPLRR